MDCTCATGKTNGVSFLPHEKLMIARALLQDQRGSHRSGFGSGIRGERMRCVAFAVGAPDYGRLHSGGSFGVCNNKGL